MTLAATAMAMATGFGTGPVAPSAAFETEPGETGETVTLRHTSGEAIAGERLRVSGGTVVSSFPTRVTTGTQVGIRPDRGVEEIRLIWVDGETSYTLGTFDVATISRPLTDLDRRLGPEPVAPTPSDCIRITSDRATVLNAGSDCVVVEPGVTLSNNINDGTDIFVQEGATVTGNVGPSGDIVLREDARIGGHVNAGNGAETLFVGADATIGGNAQVDGAIVVGDGATLAQNVNDGPSGTTELYLLPGATVTGDTNIVVYLDDTSQVGGTINAGSNEAY